MCLALGLTQMADAKSLLSYQFMICVDQSKGVTSKTLNCIAEEHAKQDKKLNLTYNELMQTLKKNRKQDLVDAQRLWVKFRDVNCNFYFDPDGGTSEAIFRSNCFINMTAERAYELEGLKNAE